MKLQSIPRILSGLKLSASEHELVQECIDMMTNTINMLERGKTEAEKKNAELLKEIQELKNDPKD